jgi:predicted NodU family carbamoyl transferase
MAKIDVTKIEGYDTMTPEEKLSALEAFEYEDNLSELERYKNAVSKANSEASEWKKKHNALLNEDEKKKTEQEEELTNLRAEVEELKKEKAVSSYKAKFLGLGYNESLAESTANAMAEGDMETVFANQKKHNETREKEIKAELLKGTPTPPSGEGGETMSLDKLKKMSATERYEYSVKHPEEYKKLYGGNS